jgi:hypothetical protein
MSRENAEEFGHDFYNTVVQSVRSVVLAYGAGKVELEKAENMANKGQLRYAPSFMRLHDASGEKPYTAREVGIYLGWTAVSGRSEGGVQASQHVLTALSVLEEGSLKPRAIMSRENAEEFGHDFYNTDVQSVRAAVLMLGAATARPEEWPEVDPDAPSIKKSDLRVAPSFVKGAGGELSPCSKVYTAQSLAGFLGRVGKSDTTPCREILTALDVLELLEEGSLKPRAIMGWREPG